MWRFYLYYTENYFFFINEREGLDGPSFFVYNYFVCVYFMDKEKLKLIVRNLESLVECLKSEVYSDAESYLEYDKIAPLISDYDEVFSDDDGYPD